MAVLILQMLSPIAGMSKYLHALSEMYFYDLENPGTSGVPDGILRDTWKLLKLHKNRIIPGKPERIRILLTFIVAPCIMESIYCSLTNKCTFY